MIRPVRDIGRVYAVLNHENARKLIEKVGTGNVKCSDFLDLYHQEIQTLGEDASKFTLE
jgi:hypothetical protein